MRLESIKFSRDMNDSVAVHQKKWLSGAPLQSVDLSWKQAQLDAPHYLLIWIVFFSSFLSRLRANHDVVLCVRWRSFETQGPSAEAPQIAWEHPVLNNVSDVKQ